MSRPTVTNTTICLFAVNLAVVPFPAHPTLYVLLVAVASFSYQGYLYHFIPCGNLPAIL